VRDGQVSPVDLVEDTFARIARVERPLNPFISLQYDDARSAARRAAESLARPRAVLGPLHGVPISIKDLILTRDALTTAGSRVYGAGLQSDHDATVVRRLRRAGAIIVGKTNLNEFALGVTTENAHFGPTRNPWNTEYVPGGSSGGSAVAVAAGLGYASVGTDTRGSIRIPASCCGITGLKPTYGLIPTDGVLPLSWTLDHVGPMTRTARDSALLLSVLTGRHKVRETFGAALDRPPRGLRVGIAPFFWQDLDEEVRTACERALALFELAGLEMRELDLRTPADALDTSSVICLAEAAVIHEPLLAESPDGYSPAVRTRLEGFSALTAVDLVKGERARLRAIEELNGAFARVDCLITPTMPALPPRSGEEHITIGGHQETVLRTLVRFTAPFSLTGSPALSIPCGFSKAGLPIGLQLVARHGREDILFRLAAHFQRETDWHLATPLL
jgi:aspartyl-tRNA(Asn)/glutamyl-tRNA(Gln) amidotransferase subunit A